MTARRWSYCRFLWARGSLHVWTRPGLSLEDVEKGIAKVFPRQTLLAVGQDAGIWRLFGSDFRAVFASTTKLRRRSWQRDPHGGCVLGRNEQTGQDAIIRFADHGLVLVGGLNNQGKTSLLKTMSESSNGVTAEVFSFSGADFPRITAEKLCERLERWKEEINAIDLSKRSQRSQKVLIVDEFLRYLHEPSKATRERLELLVGFFGAEARKYGFCLVLSAQTWANANTPLFALASGRIAFRLSNAAQGEALVGDKRAMHLEPGHALCLGFGFTLLHSFYRVTQKAT